jgi:uncharacterized protein (TIGR00369 family)
MTSAVAAMAVSPAMAETAQNPEFERLVRESFEKQQVMRTLGARLSRIAPGEIDIELPYRDALTQQHGFLHAGVVTTVLDSACGYAAFSLMPPGAGVLSIEFKVNLLAPAKGEVLIARSRVLRAGRTISVCQADGIMRSGSHELQIATMLATIMTVMDRPDIVR